MGKPSNTTPMRQIVSLARSLLRGVATYTGSWAGTAAAPAGAAQQHSANATLQVL